MTNPGKTNIAVKRGVLEFILLGREAEGSKKGREENLVPGWRGAIRREEGTLGG